MLQSEFIETTRERSGYMMRCGPVTGGGKPRYEFSMREKDIADFFGWVVEITEQCNDCSTHPFF